MLGWMRRCFGDLCRPLSANVDHSLWVGPFATFSDCFSFRDAGHKLPLTDRRQPRSDTRIARINVRL